MIRVFFNVFWPVFILIAFMLVFLRDNQLYAEWLNESLLHKLIVAGITLVYLVIVAFRGYRILEILKRYGTREEQIREMRFREMMKSEGEFTIEGFEKFFPEFTYKAKVK